MPHELLVRAPVSSVFENFLIQSTPGVKEVDYVIHLAST